MTVIIDKFDSLNSHHFSSSNQAQEEAFIPFTYSNIVMTMLKFDLQAAGLKKPIIQHHFTAHRNAPQTSIPTSRGAVDSSVYPPAQDIIPSSAKISYHIQSNISSSAPAINETLDVPPTSAAPPVSEQITQGRSCAVIIYHGRRRKTQAELLKEDWLALPFFNNMARRPRLVEYGSSRGEVRRSQRIKVRILIMS